MLKVGDRIPEFSLPGDDGKTHSSGDWKGEKLVVYFYPRDNTPGCTRESIAFSKLAKDFARAGARVIGMSRDSVASHCKFRDQHKLTVPLLSDTDLAVHKAFGAWGSKVMYGKKVEGVIRSTFAFDAAGVATHVWGSVKVDGHAEAVLAALTGAAPAPTAKKPSAEKAPAKKTAAKKTAAKPAKKDAKKASTKPAPKKAAAKKTAKKAAKKAAKKR